MANHSKTPLPPEGIPPGNGSWFAHLLKRSRLAHGLSQEALALAAEVSTRHLSFLESARATPSDEMLHRLLSVLEVPFAERNRAAAALGFPLLYPIPDGIPPEARGALALTLDSHEPFPAVVLSKRSHVLHANRGAWKLFRTFVRDPAILDAPFDMVSVVLDPRFFRDFVVDWEPLARRLVRRLHLAHLENPEDPQDRHLLERALAYPGLGTMRQILSDLSIPDPVVNLHLRRESWEVSLQVVVSAFSEPLQPALGEVFVETYHPADHPTRETFRRWERDDLPSPAP